MPKQNFEIKTFTKGIVSNPSDALDIPDDAATYSLNVDPLTEGSIGGIPDDAALKVSGFTVNVSSITYSQGDSTFTAVGTPGVGEQYDPPDESG
jgi:hypothetical protein|tara:strand:+ start:4698 stop:4979 length:282 start_codon:yes stop_codon:yes gene_type:complete